MKDDVMLLDAGEEVFVWVGPEASDNESSKAVAAAEEYIKASSASLGRTKGVSVTRVRCLASLPALRRPLLQGSFVQGCCSSRRAAL